MFCGASCKGREGLERHIESEHANRKLEEERKRVVCTWPGCAKSFTRTSNLNVHIRSAHEGARFVCGEFDLSKTEDLETWSNSQGCGQAFNLKITLENHVRYVHLMRKRPEASKLARQPSSLQHQADPTMLEQLTGVGVNSRRTLPCTFPGCHLKFTYSGELEIHVQEEHQIEQALLDSVAEAGAALGPTAAFQDVATAITEWDYAGEDFWIGADGGSEAFHAGNISVNIEEEWLRDEAEMRRLIGPDELNGLIDPSLGPLPL